VTFAPSGRQFSPPVTTGRCACGTWSAVWSAMPQALWQPGAVRCLVPGRRRALSGHVDAACGYGTWRSWKEVRRLERHRDQVSACGVRAGRPHAFSRAASTRRCVAGTRGGQQVGICRNYTAIYSLACPRTASRSLVGTAGGELQRWSWPRPKPSSDRIDRDSEPGRKKRGEKQDAADAARLTSD